MAFEWSFLVTLILSLSIVSFTLVRASSSASGSYVNHMSYNVPSNPFSVGTTAYGCFRELESFCLTQTNLPTADDCAKGGLLCWTSVRIYFNRFFERLVAGPFLLPDDYCANKEERCKDDLSIYENLVKSPNEEDYVQIENAEEYYSIYEFL